MYTHIIIHNYIYIYIYINTHTHTCLGFVDLGNPMPADGIATDFEFFARASSGSVAEVLVLRSEDHGNYVIKGSFIMDITSGTELGSQGVPRLLVWRGDFLAFIVHGGYIDYADCPDCMVAELPPTASRAISYALSEEKSGKVALGKRYARAYRWSASLLPMICAHVAESPNSSPHPLTKLYNQYNKHTDKQKIA